ncbi:hypothetical protein CR105_06250 [Massilia eurypsychrophila]|uniref:Uncharacterized protein n=1 Tax=Massilia eurypsychrophila TaxID=1485217 RepID=A0A2G8TI04_9BURK|nr:hypothetical protein CR105_06250 [Massilia eurypsychrophila]
MHSEAKARPGQAESAPPPARARRQLAEKRDRFVRSGGSERDILAISLFLKDTMKLSFRLALALVACIGLLSACSMFSATADLDLRLTRPSINARYVVSMRPLGEPAAINQIHAWQIIVTSSAGAGG